MPRTVSVLGATGSIGRNTLDVLRQNPSAYRVEALTAARNVRALAASAREFGAATAVIADDALYPDLKEALEGSGAEAAAGARAMIEAAQRPADWVMAAIVGAGGLAPTLAALERGATVALANKECLVCAGDLFMRTSERCGARVLPVDSEHNAVFQALGCGRREDVARVVLTASGGPFRTWTAEAMRSVTPEEALKHPNWSMGPKVSVDSATLMNKGLELIEAHHLFGLKPEELDVLVHPQSLVHALVEFRDGSVMAQMGVPDMRIPIAHTLAWPARIETPAAHLDLARVATLSFEAPDLRRFPALAVAKAALAQGGGAPTVLNAANEVAVAEFLAGRLRFADIPALVEATLSLSVRHGLERPPADLAAVFAVDHNSRLLAAGLLPEIAAKAS